jgi:pteridine reductase
MSAAKVALVTGSGKRRVGAHVADALARRGYSLVIHYHTSEADAHETVTRYQAQGNPAIAVGADLGSETDVKAMVDTTLSRFGRIDVLVNCAATYSSKRLEDVTAVDVRYFLEVNTLGTFLCCQHVGLAMTKQQEGGCIITFGDWATARPYLNYAAYLTSKGAIPALTRSFAVELGTRNANVRVNCIEPGPVLFPPDMPAAEKQQAIENTLLKREGTPEHIAQAVLFLIDNDFVTGVCLPVDGGRTVFSTDSIA